MRVAFLARVLVVLIGASAVAGPTVAQSPESIEFFENRIRPVLIKHCYECHSSDSDEIGGSLALDSATGMMTGGDSGPAIDPGNVASSLLISAIRYESSEMPPDGRLPDSIINDFEAWIAAGASDPRTSPPDIQRGSQPIDLQAGREFWAFQPLASSPIPTDFHPSSQGRIDQYLLKRLDAAELVPGKQADPSTRLRRLAFDLTGLPPDPLLQVEWLADPSPEHWRKIVDALLASPAFAEHWARHWMDVARYADSNGSDFNATHHEAWRYRDYLIRSFAIDRPFDEMIRQQIAGDLLTAENDAQRYDNLVATTFLMLGTKMLSERDKAKLTLDVVDEQIDTIGRAFLGLTLGCARCHDHKFDPVPTEDYYALAGIFKNTITLNGESQKYVSTWNRVPLPVSASQRQAVADHAASVKSIESEIREAEASLKTAKQRNEDSYAGIIVDDADAKKTGQWKASTYFKHFVGDGYVHDDNSNKGKASIEFATRLPHSGRYEVRISYSPNSTRASRVPIAITTATGTTRVTLDQRKVQIDPIWSVLGTYSFSADTDAVVTLWNEGTSGYVIADAVQFLPAGDDTSIEKDSNDLRRSESGQLAGGDGESKDDPTDSQQAVAIAQQKLDELKQRFEQVKADAPPPLPEAMAPTDRPTDELADSAVHIRGEVKNLGSNVARGFIQVCSSGSASIRRPQGSGRMELADWLTDPDNPLVARVFVNRVWMHLLGQGLVRTVDNFGVQGERPTHPELLDALAAKFIRDRWQIKPLIREIVHSHAYSQTSEYDDRSVVIDPENRLLWRMHRRRLPAESIRDSMIAIAGLLDQRGRVDPMHQRGTLVSSNNGDSTATFDDIAQPCRSIYLPVVRSYLPPMLAALDVADPDLLVGKRPTTNVPAQALVLINSPEVNQWAKQTAERIMDKASGFEERLELTYRLCLQRAPDAEDRLIAEAFFADQPESSQKWHDFVASIFAGTEFRLLD